MQTWVLYYDIKKSAASLDRTRLGAQLYEGIHILSSLLGINYKLVTPKRSVANHPVAKKWKGYEHNLFEYILIHVQEWKNRGYRCEINIENINIIMNSNLDLLYMYNACPSWVDSGLINSHRAKLIERLPDHYNKIFLDDPEL